MSKLSRGLYEQLVTEVLAEQLRDPALNGLAQTDDLRNAEAADRIALHVGALVSRAIDEAPGEDRADVGIALARRLIEQIVESVGKEKLAGTRLAEPTQVLRAVLDRLPDGRPG